MFQLMKECKSIEVSSPTIFIPHSIRSLDLSCFENHPIPEVIVERFSIVSMIDEEAFLENWALESGIWTLSVANMSVPMNCETGVPNELGLNSIRKIHCRSARKGSNKKILVDKYLRTKSIQAIQPNGRGSRKAGQQFTDRQILNREDCCSIRY
jgi:hypothetical protein